MSLDPQRFLRAAAYLARLPAGIDSYPECQVRVDGRLNLRRDFSLLTREDGLPAMVRDFLLGSITKAWMPEVISVTVLSMARDALLQTDDDLRAWSFQDALDVFDNPLNNM